MLERTLVLSEFLLAAMALAVGSIVLSIVYEAFAGHRSISLPYTGIATVIIIGSLLYLPLGAPSIVIMLGIYGTWCVVAGLVDRIRHKRLTPQRDG
jgi:uncharacterized membrane protein